ncbi:MAG: LamG domain-containing protein [Verrucomicrobiales bacterium]|nr:LamG domain-containing protein [Verrucomicrobiales bacterium]
MPSKYSSTFGFPSISSTFSYLALLLFISAVAQLSFAGEKTLYKTLPSTDKSKHPDLSFSLTFDGKSVAADHTLGNPDSFTFGDGNLEFRIVPGFDNQNAFSRDPEEKLHYPVAKNIDHRQGTMIFWIMAQDYDPGSVSVSDPVKTHKPYLFARFYQEKKWVTLFFYQYYTSPTANFYWQNSEADKGVSTIASAPLTEIKAGQWFQLAATWDQKEIKVYLNGKFQSTAPLPEVAAETQNLIPEAKRSWLGVRQMMWDGAEESGKTAIDDITIYQRPLTALEIKRQYHALVDSVDFVDLPPFDISIDGVDDGKGPLDRLNLSLNLTSLPPKWREEVTQKKLKLHYQITLPDKSKQSGDWELSKLKDHRIFNKISQAGNYQLDLTLTNKKGEEKKLSQKFQRPDTEWFGNTLGLEDRVPTPWTELSINDKNIVKMWGREYHFGDSPLPDKILHQGESLLKSGPKLLIKTPSGEASIKYTRNSITQKTTFIEIKGSGKAADFTLDWTTRIEFDGMILFNYTIKGKPTIESMKLVWDVAAEYSKYLLTPLLKTSSDGTYSFPLNLNDRSNVSQLWLTSEKKGFCWTLEHDANWIHNKGEHPLRITVDADTKQAHCEVEMIAHRTQLPENVPYHAIFIATPSRPLPKRSRTYRLGSGGSVKYKNLDTALVSHQGAGLNSVFTFKPDSDFGDYMDILAARKWTPKPLAKMDRLAFYGGATALNNHEPEGIYFGRYWELPGGPIVPFHDKRKHHEIKCLQTNTCPHTSYSDYILNNIKQLFDHPKQRVSAIYYDLSGNTACSNALHGCAFKDRFGRPIQRMILLGLRKHLRRTMQYCHQRGRDTIYHAHSYYNPVCHSFADYWCPGEQYASTMLRKKSPYVYNDDIPDAVFRSEINMHIRGSGILFLPNLSRADKNYGTTEQTEAMLTKLLLNDVPLAIAFCDGAVIDRWWGIALRYDLDEATIHFHDQQKEITSDNPSIKISYYSCKDGRTLIIAGNVSKKSQPAQIDLGQFKQNTLTLEYVKTSITPNDKGFKIKLPARAFAVIGLAAAE